MHPALGNQTDHALFHIINSAVTVVEIMVEDGSISFAALLISEIVCIYAVTTYDLL